MYEKTWGALIQNSEDLVNWLAAVGDDIPHGELFTRNVGDDRDKYVPVDSIRVTCKDGKVFVDFNI